MAKRLKSCRTKPVLQVSAVCILEQNENLSEPASGGGRRRTNFINNLNGELDKIMEVPGEDDNNNHMLSDDDSSWTDYHVDDKGDSRGFPPTGVRVSQ
ncbi:hypothetical protein V6N13_102093 [Hibiscus sabdariffa]